MGSKSNRFVWSGNLGNNTAHEFGGGAIESEAGTGDSTTISGSTFTGNSALDDGGHGSSGGAILDSGATLTISNSRIVGNTVAGGGANGSGLAVDGGDTGTAINNWWGCNGGPGASGCDTATVISSGTLTFNPWLVLSISASPSQIDPSATSKLTADLTHNSSGTGGFSVPDRTPVSFGGATLGSISNASTTLTSGQGTATYTAGSTAGNDSPPATVDNATPSTTINILDSVSFNTSPAGLSYTVDGTGYTTPQTFNWVVGSLHPVSTTSPQAGTTGTQYVFNNWSDSGVQSHSITAPSMTTAYTASFTTQYQLTTQTSPSAAGSVTPASGNYYSSGAVIPVTATPNMGFMFSSWSSSNNGSFDSTSSASTNFNMPAAATTVTGNFAPVIVAVSTTTTLTSNNNPSFTAPPNNSVTFTATVTSSSMVTVNEGTVTFTDGANNLACSGGNPAAVSNGTATCTTSFTTEGAHNITAMYTGTVNFENSSGNIIQTVNNHTVQTGNQFCNQGAITIPSAMGAATPYPSNIFVTGESGNITSMTVTLKNISSSNMQPTDLLLVGPTGAAIVPFASVGDGSTISDVNITLDDAAASLLPGGSPLSSGTFKPTSLTGSTTLVFPAPAPTINTSNYAATDGSATLTSQFGGTAPNGTWALYAMANADNGAATINGGWCVTVNTGTAPSITSGNSTTFKLSAFNSFPVTTTGTPTPSLMESGGLPNGVGFVDNGNGTGTLSGTPTVDGTYPITFTASNGVGSPAMQSFTLNVSGPVVSLNPTSVNFGDVYFRSTQSKNVVVSNLGNAPLSVGKVSLTGTDHADFAATSYCGSKLMPNTSCKIVITYTPDSQGSFSDSATLIIPINSPNRPQQVPISGTVINPIAGFKPKNLPFGTQTVGTSTTKTASLINIGTTALNISNIAVTGTNRNDFTQTNDCPASLAPSDSCTISVTFDPHAVGSRSADVTVTDNAQSVRQTLPLTGTGD